MVAQMNLQGMVKRARGTRRAFVDKQGNKVRLVPDADGEHFRRPQLEEELAQALSAYSASCPAQLSVADRPSIRLRATEGGADDRVQTGARCNRSDPERARDARHVRATVTPTPSFPRE